MFNVKDVEIIIKQLYILMKKLRKLLSKHLVFTASALILVISGGLILSSHKEVPEVSAVGVSNTQVLADVPLNSVLQDTCTGLEGVFKELCQQTVKKAVDHPTKNVTICRKFFNLSFFCHTEKVSIPVETSVCQSLYATENAFLQQAFGGEAACELRLQNLKPVPTPVLTSSPVVATPVPVRPVTPGADTFTLPSYPGALQVVGLGKNPIISGPIYFSLFYSKDKPSSYPVSRFLLTLGDSFLQIGGQVMTVQNINGTITFSGSVDTTNRLIRCMLYSTNRQLSCTLASDGKGLSDFVIQKLPDVSFYHNTLFTSLGDF